MMIDVVAGVEPPIPARGTVEFRKISPIPDPSKRRPRRDAPSIQQRFLTFHANNPWVYEELVKLARKARQRGLSRIGIELCFGALRWNRMMKTGGEGGFKLNDHFTSRFARLIMEQEKDLEGFFEVRALRSE